MKTWQETASELASEIYSAFLEEVVAKGVLSDREGALDEKIHARIAKKTHVDGRIPRLMTISGKGGWSANPKQREKYALSTNVTLLDHLLSVVRGSLLFYALDKLGQNPEMDLAVLRRRMRVLAAIAFLHDIDKALSLERNATLPLSEIAAAMERYNINVFLGAVVSFTPEQIRYLIELVEDTQRHRNPPTELPPREYDGALMRYISLADKLDGIWLSADPKQEHGLDGVMAYLGKAQHLSTGFLKEWRAVDLYDPHHPFLLDELQVWLSYFSWELSGIPPLLEVHHDGRLFMLLPASQHKMIIDKALEKFCADLPFFLDVNISNRGIPALYNGQPDYQTLKEFLINLSRTKLSNLFLIKAELKSLVTIELDRLLGDMELKPSWPKKSDGLISIYTGLDDISSYAESALRKAALLVLLLNINLTGDKKNNAINYEKREKMLLIFIEKPRPNWLNKIKSDDSRRVLTALWALAAADSDENIDAAIFGEDGLLQRWLEGENGQPGFNAFIEVRGVQIIAAVERHFRQLLNQQRITVTDETAEHRCLFTDEPVAANETIDEALGLYEVKVSAFSGRDNRLETITSDQSQTHVGAVSIAEHKLRAHIHEAKGGKKDGVPTLISSPVTSGLFGGLGLTNSREIQTRSLYDLNRLEIKKDMVIHHSSDIYRQRHRIGRFERMPERLASNKKNIGQIEFLALLIHASRRLGRPIHIFRGLPAPQPAFFYCDALPSLIANLIGGSNLRLEQLPYALKQLQLANILLETHGLGYEVLMLYASPKTRFAAICLAWCRMHDALKDDKAKERNGLNFVSKRLEYEHELELRSEDSPMNEQDGALVNLGKAAAKIQKKPDYQASTNEEMLVFNLCIEFAEGARVCNQTDEASLVNGIASELEINLGRKDLIAGNQYRNGRNLRDECIFLAEQFVHEVWQSILRQRPPTQRARRILGSIYRMSFIMAARPQKEGQTVTSQTEDN